MTIKLEIKLEDLNKILIALDKQPHGQVFKLISSIRIEAEKQIKEAEKETKK